MSPAGFNQSSLSTAQLQVVVETRLGKRQALPIDGSRSGWRLRRDLRCQNVKCLKGAKVGTASFTIVPQNEADKAFENVLGAATVDDQVRVTLMPVNDELTDQPGGGGSAQQLFAGVLARPSFKLQANARTNEEGVDFVGFPFARVLDNDSTEHLITGRWVADKKAEGGSSADMYIVQSPALPAVFNHRGRKNCHKDATVTTAGGIVAPVFTHDDDPNATWWTLRKAVLSTIVVWLYGITGQALNRHTFVHTDLLAQLQITADNADRQGIYVGLDSRLPEVDVHGLGVLEAIERICTAAGFEMAAEPVTDGERDYRLRVWRNGTGDDAFFDLDKRDTAPRSPEAHYRANNLSTLVGFADGVEIVNEIIGRGRAFVQATLRLKPLWSPDEFPTETIDGALQSAKASDGGYGSKYLPGGSDFDKFGHVGRMWGLDCVGGFPGYDSVPYQHDVDGFDFVEQLGLDVPNAWTFERENKFNVTEPIRWTRRVRRALKLRSAAAAAKGVKFVLEVSEDGGSEGGWAVCPIKFTTLKEHFGIMLTGVANLASVNNATFLSEQKPIPAPEDSWLQMIEDRDLIFRLTCTVEADHAAVYNGDWQPTGGSGYRKGQLFIQPVEELWGEPSNFFNDTENWDRLVGHGVVAEGVTDDVTTLKDAADQRRDALETFRLSMTFRTAVMDAQRYKLGDVIKAVRGRNLNLAVNAGGTVRHANVAAITFHLHPAQSIQLDISDTAVRGAP